MGDASTPPAAGPPHALVFDFDGLILDTEWCEYHSVAAVFDEHGLELVLEEWQTIVGTADHPHWSEMLEVALGRPLLDRDEVVERRRDHHHLLIREEVVLPGVEALLEQAEAAGVALAVASSSPRDWVEGHLDRLGLLSRFAAVRTRDDVHRAKPDPALYLAATEAVGADPGRSVALEDSRHGVTSAKAAGLACVAVPNRITAGLDLSHADAVVASLAEVDLGALARLVVEAAVGEASAGEASAGEAAEGRS